LWLSGGWVPELLLTDADVGHVGSIDVDLALNHLEFDEVGYKTIMEHLLARGYVQGKQPFIFHREVGHPGARIEIQVDFLAGEYAGTGRSHRTQKAQDMRPRKARGVDLAFQMFEDIEITDHLPEGGKDTERVQVASIPVFIVMKGMAIRDRLKEKDAWDIYYCVRNYPGGVEQLKRDFHPLIGQGLVKEGLKNIAEKFSSPDAVGPTHVVNFEEITDLSARELLQRDVFERIQFLLEILEP
jgi:hypothetical protein